MQWFGHNFGKLTVWLSSMDTLKVNDIFGTELIIYEQQISDFDIDESKMRIRNSSCTMWSGTFWFHIFSHSFKSFQTLTISYIWFEIHGQCLGRNYTKTNQTKNHTLPREIWISPEMAW